MNKSKEKKKIKSIYVTESSWEALRKFAPTVGYRKISELIVDTSLLIMNNEELHWIYDQGRLLKLNPESSKLKAYLCLIIDDVIEQLNNQGIDISRAMEEAVKKINLVELGDEDDNL